MPRYICDDIKCQSVVLFVYSLFQPANDMFSNRTQLLHVYCIQKRHSGGSLPVKSAPKQVSIDVPKGNINGKWKHDLHDQLQDDGPARTRFVWSCYTVVNVMNHLVHHQFKRTCGFLSSMI